MQAEVVAKQALETELATGNKRKIDFISQGAMDVDQSEGVADTDKKPNSGPISEAMDGDGGSATKKVFKKTIHVDIGELQVYFSDDDDYKEGGSPNKKLPDLGGGS